MCMFIYNQGNQLYSRSFIRNIVCKVCQNLISRGYGKKLMKDDTITFICK